MTTDQLAVLAAGVAAVAAVLSALFALVTWRHARRVDPPARWAVEFTKQTDGYRMLAVKNTGTKTARDVTITCVPDQRDHLMGDDDGSQPTNVHPSSTRQLTLGPRLMGRPDVESVAVSWRRLRFLRAHWSTAV